MVTSRGSLNSSARGFSLVELLVVMFIIGLVVAITIPALGYARTLAKKTTTLTFMNGFAQACTTFQTDHSGRLPGYFSAREMGDNANVAQVGVGGFTAMDNVLLDLAGGVTAAAGTGTISVGPTTTLRVNVDPDKIGVAGPANKVYWAPDAKFFETQTSAGKVGEAVNLGLKSVVDSFGNPLLFWATDESSLTPISATPAPLGFASESASPGNSSRFYRAGNTAYLESDALGKRGRSQIAAANGSAISSAGNNANVRSNIMTAYLGNPSAILNPADAGGQAAWVPSAGRGKFMIHSAGADGVFLGKEDNGYKKNGGASMTYSNNFAPGTSKPVDLAGDFDDLLVGGGH